MGASYHLKKLGEGVFEWQYINKYPDGLEECKLTEGRGTSGG